MIRPAVVDDLPRLLEMGRAFNVEAGYAEIVPFDQDSFGRTLAALAAAKVLMVIDHKGAAVGMAGADIGASVCNHQVRIAREAFWYIEPEHRKGGGLSMLNALECAAKNHGVSIFDVVAENGKRDEALARLYRAAKFNPAERTFRKFLI